MESGSAMGMGNENSGFSFLNERIVLVSKHTQKSRLTSNITLTHSQALNQHSLSVDRRKLD